MNANRPNILLIVMDTARAQTVIDNSEVMPNVHEFAAEGTFFTNAFSTAPWTLPSHASLFTGQYTRDHGTHAGSKQFDPHVPTLAEKLQGSGYQTVGFSNNVWISPEFGFDRGFDKLRTSLHLVDGGADLGSIAKENYGFGEQGRAIFKTLLRRDGHRTLINGLYSKFFRGRYDDGARLTNWRIKRWLSGHWNRDMPFFMFVNYLEPHLKYNPPKKFKYRFTPEGLTPLDLNTVNQDAWSFICNQIEMKDQDFQALSALYKGELNYLDYRLGAVFNMLEKKGILDETIVVVIGDHGENLGDHGLMDHQYCLFDTLLHVPLIIRYPDEFAEGKRCEKPVELRDIYPSLLSAAEINTPETSSVSSQTLQYTLTNGGSKRIYAEYLHPQPSMSALKQRTGSMPDKVRKYDRSLRSVRAGKWKLIVGSDGSRRLFDLASDPGEQYDVSMENESIVEKLVSSIDTRFGRFDVEQKRNIHEVDIATQNRLEDLGYF